jgi:hypothetical protein
MRMIEDRRRRLVPGRTRVASASTKAATASGAVGSAERPCSSPYAAKIEKSPAQPGFVLSA